MTRVCRWSAAPKTLTTGTTADDEAEYEYAPANHGQMMKVMKWELMVGMAGCAAFQVRSHVLAIEARESANVCCARWQSVLCPVLGQLRQKEERERLAYLSQAWQLAVWCSQTAQARQRSEPDRAA